MLISEQLQEALAGPTDISDTFRSLSSLARYNNGLWKSDRQARFLLNRISSPGYRDRSAEAWARRHGYRGHAITNIVSDKRYGRRDVSKVRYYGDVFVVDNGGVVAKGRLKISQAKPKQGQYGHEVDWGGTKVEFERKKIPTIVVDVEKERQAAVRKNEPDIEMIKSIPGWEGKDILVDFIRQLENGRALSPAQKGVVQRMMPEKDIFLGQKEDWKHTWERYKKLITKALVPALCDYHVEREKGFEAQYQQFRKEKGEKAYWHHRMPDVAGTEAAFRNYKFGQGWYDREAVLVLEQGIGRVNLAAISGSPNHDMERDVGRAIWGKKPSKAALRVIDWLTRVVERFGDATKDQMLALIKKQKSMEFETHKGRIFPKMKR